MNTLPIFTGCGELREDAGQQITALMNFPEEPASRTQYVELMNSEMKRASETDAQKFRFSKLTKGVDKSLEGKRSQIGIAGLTTLCLHVININKQGSPTLYAATNMAESIVRKAKKFNPNPFFTNDYVGDEIVETRYKSVTGFKDIDKRFRKYSNIAHLAAVSLLHSQNTPTRRWPDEIRNDPPRFIRTVAAFETEVVNRFPQYFKNPWRVGNPLPQSIAELEPYDLGQEFAREFGIDTIW